MWITPKSHLHQAALRGSRGKPRTYMNSHSLLSRLTQHRGRATVYKLRDTYGVVRQSTFRSELVYRTMFLNLCFYRLKQSWFVTANCKTINRLSTVYRVFWDKAVTTPRTHPLILFVDLYSPTLYLENLEQVANGAKLHYAFYVRVVGSNCDKRKCFRQHLL